MDFTIIIKKKLRDNSTVGTYKAQSIGFQTINFPLIKNLK